MTVERDVAKRLRHRTDILDLPTPDRYAEIQLVLMDIPGAKLDDRALLRRIDHHLTRITPRVKSLCDLTDVEMSAILGKSRPTVNAYLSGRLTEVLSAKALDKLEALVEERGRDVERLLQDIRGYRARNKL